MEELMKLRTMVAPLALGLVFAVATARVAGAQSPAPASQPAAQQPPAQQPPASQSGAQPATPAPAAAADATFSGQVGMLIVQVKADQTQVYESLLAKLKESLAKNEKPERKAMAAGWKIYKSPDAAGAVVVYVHIIDPVAAGQNYIETYKLIYETFPTEVAVLYAKTKDATVPSGINRLNLVLVTNLGGS
jgi:hypothetical protein